MFKSNTKLGSLIVGDIIHLDPNILPNLKIISKKEADEIAKVSLAREFIITTSIEKKL